MVRLGSITTPPITCFIGLTTCLYILVTRSQPQFRRFPSHSSDFLLNISCPLAFLSNLLQAWNTRFEPRQECILLNAAWAMVLLYFTMKVLEVGVVGFESSQALEEYRYIGFEPQEVVSEEEEEERRRNSWWRDSYWGGGLALLLSMRGYGYKFGPSPKESHSPLVKESTARFIFRSTRDLLFSHLLLLVSTSFITLPYPRRLNTVSSFTSDFVPPHLLPLLTESITYSFWGVFAYSTFLVTYSMFSLLSLLIHTCLYKYQPLTSNFFWAYQIAPFDTREYPPLFDRPYYPTSVRRLWSSQWHGLFRRSFFVLAYRPVVKFLPRHFGRPFALLSSFLLSALIHEVAISFALKGIALRSPRIASLERYGGYAFFLFMGTLVLVEAVFERLTGYRVRGFGGFIWSAITVGALGGFLLYNSWSHLQFLDGIPTFEHWSRWRWIIPMLCLIPGSGVAAK